MKVFIKTQRDLQNQSLELHIEDNPENSRPTVLDILIKARSKIPDLAFRYGCRNKLCGVCTVEVNGKPRLACRTSARDGMTVGPVKSLPVLQDLVVRRDAVNRQLRARLPNPKADEQARHRNHDAFDSLGRCIECYACLENCPLHAENDLDQSAIHGFVKGNPYSFLRIQRVIEHPGATEQNKVHAFELASHLGLDQCIDCHGCICGVGINLMSEVITPLLKQDKLFKK